VQHSGKRGTRGRKLVLNGGSGRSYVKNTLPRVASPSTRGRKPLPRVPNCLGKDLVPEPSQKSKLSRWSSLDLIAWVRIWSLNFTVHLFALFVWLISHQPAVLFSQNKSAASNQPAVFLSQNKSAPAISHQPNEQTDY
jgi:hypothetical protein